jgi:hypothetical protein
MSTTPRRITVDETGWWDRIAAAADMLAARPDARRGSAVAGGRTLQIIGNRAPRTAPETAPADSVAAYIFHGVRDTEVLRRLTQMPDETPFDLLAGPVAVYCPDLKCFVSVNDEDTALEEHLENLGKDFGS